MKRFVGSLSVLLLTVPIAMAQALGGGSAASIALRKLAEWSAPAIDAMAILILIIGIVAASFEFFKRSLGWAIGLFIGSSILFAVLWALAAPISQVLNTIAGIVAGS
jgi:hypothetical protein